MRAIPVWKGVAGAMTLMNDRAQAILRLLEERSSVSVSEISKLLDLSEVTVRKILDSMQSEGWLKRTWGGAVSVSSTSSELRYSDKFAKQVQEKQAMARIAYDMIDEGDAVLLDGGTTNLELARLLSAGSKKQITVATTAVHIALELAKSPNIRVIITGGEVRTDVFSCIGPIAENMLRSTLFDKGFIIPYHCTVQRGLTHPDMEEAFLKQSMINACKETFSLIDHTKFGQDSMNRICDISDLDYVITDWLTEPSVLERIREKNVRLIVAPAPQA